MEKIHIDPEQIKKYAKFIKKLYIQLSQNIAEIEVEFKNLSTLWGNKEFNSFAIQFTESLKYVKQFIKILNQHNNKLSEKLKNLKEQTMKIDNSLSKLNDKIYKTQKNENQKILNIEPIADYINNLDSIEKIQASLVKGVKLESLLNDKIREIGFTLVPKKDDWDFKIKSTFYIKRHSIKDKSGIEKVRLTIGKKPDGKHYFKIDTQNNQLFYTKNNNRISVPGKLNSNLEKALQKQRPENHEAHHLIPDSIARNDPFIDALRTKNLFDIDHASNGIWLPRDQKAKDNCSESKNLPIHKGNHPNWNIFVMTILNDQKNLLEKKYNKKNLKALDPSILSKALKHVEKTLINKLKNNEWEAYWK